MDIETLRLFVDLSGTHSFSKTAERNFMSQSAVSQRIRTLEQEYGQVLVERGKGRPGAQFTEAGLRLLDGAREILGRADALKRELAEMSGVVGGTLRVATVYSIGLHALTPRVTSFISQYPQVNLHLEYLRTDRIYDAVVGGAIDCGIVACPRERAQIDVIPLECERMVLIVPPSHPLAALETVPVERLQGMPFVAFDADIPTSDLIDNLLRSHDVSVTVIHCFDNIETIKRVVEIGLGIAIVPEPTIHREVRDGTLAARPLEGEALIRPTGILLRKGKIVSGALSRFLDVLGDPKTAPAPIATA